MSPDKHNWQDLASDLGLSFEIDPNAPELPPEPEPVIAIEQTVITSITVEPPVGLEPQAEDAPEDSVDGGLNELAGGPPGETLEEARKRKRGRRRRRGRGPNDGGPSEFEAQGSETEAEPRESRELVGSVVGRSHAEMDSEEDDSHHSGHGHSSQDEEEFVLEDLTNLNVPIWTELIDSLYRPER